MSRERAASTGAGAADDQPAGAFSELFSSDRVVIGAGSYGGVARVTPLPGRGEAHVRAVMRSYGDPDAERGPLPQLVVKQLELLNSAHRAEQAAREQEALSSWRHRGIVRFASTHLRAAVSKYLLLFSPPSLSLPPAPPLLQFGAWSVEDVTLLVLEAADGIGDGPLVGEQDLRGASAGDFWRYVVTRRTLPEGVVRFIAFQVLSAVHFLHSRSPPVIHRDLKTENMLCCGPAVPSSAGLIPIVKISDFGTTRSVPVERQIGLERHAPLAHTMTVVSDDNGRGRYMGSSQFIAPEIWRGMDRGGGAGGGGGGGGGVGAGGVRSVRKVADYATAADIYSLGVTLFFILTRQLPHDSRASEAEIKRRALAGELSTGHLYDARVSEDARDLLGHMLTLDSRERASAAQLLRHRWFAPVLDEARRLFGDERC